MTDAVRTISQLVRSRAIRDGVDLAADGALAERLAAEEVRRYGERALAGAVVPIGDERAAAAGVLAELTGYGALQPLFDDPDVEEIWINGPERAYQPYPGAPACVASSVVAYAGDVVPLRYHGVFKERSVSTRRAPGIQR